ncbi:PREDICTED: beta-microseminoprotein-like isoform X2 [Chinchilla lanigera]|uniref:beta-microseminoprotein-like isoform X2 n=1 Tax=Chinchilla lanigera TaxID=34839 RepID=UPI00038EC554|nr:PREDICTED: beta-microseminoprotein-like isoform X2 [Chinchilla lanigera]
MTLLGALLVLATFVTTCSAHCYTIPLMGGLGEFPTECKDLDGTSHSMNSNWITSNCESCSCNGDGALCCSIVDIPVDFDKIKCDSYFHKDNCSYTVMERENPGKPCEVHAWIL